MKPFFEVKDGQSGFRPPMTRIRIMIMATTSSMWMNPLIVYDETIPSSQPIIKTAAIKFSILDILFFQGWLGNRFQAISRNQFFVMVAQAD